MAGPATGLGRRSSILVATGVVAGRVDGRKEDSEGRRGESAVNVLQSINVRGVREMVALQLSTMSMHTSSALVRQLD